METHWDRTSTFIDTTAAPSPIIGTGTITASLSATGTPSNTTFLRGDNTWSSASSTGSAQISVLDEGSQVTADVDSFNFYVIILAFLKLSV